eukprot:scaffold1175_cov330-Prasinococcus_capsulatus_cf.AAC.10
MAALSMRVRGRVRCNSRPRADGSSFCPRSGAQQVYGPARDRRAAQRLHPCATRSGSSEGPARVARARPPRALPSRARGQEREPRRSRQSPRARLSGPLRSGCPPPLAAGDRGADVVDADAAAHVALGMMRMMSRAPWRGIGLCLIRYDLLLATRVAPPVHSVPSRRSSFPMRQASPPRPALRSDSPAAADRAAPPASIAAHLSHLPSCSCSCSSSISIGQPRPSSATTSARGAVARRRWQAAAASPQDRTSRSLAQACTRSRRSRSRRWALPPERSAAGHG